MYGFRRHPLRAAASGIGLALLCAWAASAECVAPDVLGTRDPVLQRELEGRLQQAGLGRALESGALAVSLLDTTRGAERFYAGINDDVMLYAASLPKIAILLAVVEGVERGEIRWDDEFHWKLERMINVSDNAYATWGAELVGLRTIAAVLRDPRYCLYDERVGGLWVGRPYRKGGASYRDPLKNISHGATARQTARFYALLDAGALVSPHWSARMLALMAPPGYHHKFVGAIESRSGVRFDARKSGTWMQFHSDSALIQHGANRFVLVGLAEHPDGGRWLRELARVTDDLIREGVHRGWPAPAFRAR